MDILLLILSGVFIGYLLNDLLQMINIYFARKESTEHLDKLMQMYEDGGEDVIKKAKKTKRS